MWHSMRLQTGSSRSSKKVTSGVLLVGFSQEVKQRFMMS